MPYLKVSKPLLVFWFLTGSLALGEHDPLKMLPPPSPLPAQRVGNATVSTPVAAISDEPRVFILSYGRLKGEKGEADSATQIENFVEPLKACGIKPVLVDDIELAQLQTRIGAEKAGRNSVILVNAHGDEKSNPEENGYRIGSSFSKVPLMDGNEAITNLRAGAPQTPIWLGTCSSGSCSTKIACVGAECRQGQMANHELFAWREISKLLCDSHSGKCDLWKKLDPKGTGTIGPNVLRSYLVAQKSNSVEYRFEESARIFGADGKAETNLLALAVFAGKDAFQAKAVEVATSLTPEGGPHPQSRDRDSYRGRCVDGKGSFVTEPDRTKVEYALFCQEGDKSGRVVVHSRKDPLLIGQADILKRVKEKCAGFPECAITVTDREGDPLKLAKAKCVVLANLEVYYACQGTNPEPAYGKPTYLPNRYSPELRDFSLHSDKCGEKIRAGG